MSIWQEGYRTASSVAGPRLAMDGRDREIEDMVALGKPREGVKGLLIQDFAQRYHQNASAASRPVCDAVDEVRSQPSPSELSA